MFRSRVYMGRHESVVRPLFHYVAGQSLERICFYTRGLSRTFGGCTSGLGSLKISLGKKQVPRRAFLLWLLWYVLDGTTPDPLERSRLVDSGCVELPHLQGPSFCI